MCDTKPEQDIIRMRGQSSKHRTNYIIVINSKFGNNLCENKTTIFQNYISGVSNVLESSQ